MEIGQASLGTSVYIQQRITYIPIKFTLTYKYGLKLHFCRNISAIYQDFTKVYNLANRNLPNLKRESSLLLRELHPVLSL